MLAFVLALTLGCTREPQSAEEALARLSEAVAAHDGGRLYDALDLETRWSWMSISRTQREAYDILLSNFPEGPDRERQLRRFRAAALAGSTRDLFAREVKDGLWTELATRLKGAPRLTIRGDQAEAVTADGKKLPFHRSAKQNAGWGYAGLRPEGEELKRRAIADLELIRTSAADWERAATRQGR